jgi:hypothetical protein
VAVQRALISIQSDSLGLRSTRTASTPLQRFCFEKSTMLVDFKIIYIYINSCVNSNSIKIKLNLK